MGDEDGRGLWELVDNFGGRGGGLRGAPRLFLWRGGGECGELGRLLLDIGGGGEP